MKDLDRDTGDMAVSNRGQVSVKATPRRAPLRTLIGPASSLRGQLVRGGTGSLAVKMINTILTIGLAIVLARVLDPEGYGIYTFAFSLASMLAIPAKAGLPSLLVREVAKYQLHERWGLLRGLLKRANQLLLIMTVLIVLIAGATAWFILEDKGALPRLVTFLWALALVPLLALENLLGAALRGLRQVIQGQLPKMLLRPGLLILLVIAVWYAGKLTPVLAMALHVLAGGLAVIIGVILLLYFLPRGVRKANPRYDVRAWMRSVLPLSFVAGMQVINGQTDIVMLGLLATNEDVGVYRVTVQGAGLVAFGLSVANMAMTPHFARLYEEQDIRRLQRIVTGSARVIFAFALPVALTFILFGDVILTFVFGTEYARGHIALSTLCIGYLFNTAFGPIGSLLNMTGHERDAARVIGMTAGLNIVLNLLFIPSFGIEGAALATTITFLTSKIFLWRAVHYRLQIDSTLLNLKGHN